MRTLLKSPLLKILQCPNTRTKSQFTSTVLLPKTTFPLHIKDKSEHEIELQKICGFQDLYEWQSRAHEDKTPFILHDGPPYANGDVHVGHALNKILKDITNRYQMLQGRRVQYKPGWDCHGLPIEMKAIKTKDFKSLSPSEIRHKACAFAEKTITMQKQAFQRWGVMADWHNDDNCYFTFNKAYEVVELKAFYEMYKQGLVYRDLKPVYWSPSSKTALAEAELEYNAKHISRSVYVTFPLCHSSKLSNLFANESVLIWTTQPWTLPANQALCFSPDIKYCFVKVKSSQSVTSLDGNTLYLVAVDCIPEISKKLDVEFDIVDTFEATTLEGLECVHPMSPQRTCTMFNSPHATADLGTGIVHTAPAHGQEDFEIAQQHGLPMQSNVDDDGRFTSDAGFDLEGKFIFSDGNNAVIEILKQQQNLVHEHDYVHSFPYDWRTKKPICVKTSRQWFINTDSLQEKAIGAIKDVKIHPETGRIGMMSQLRSRSYWCISRQRVWGVPIPVFYHKNSGEVFINDASINHLLSVMRDHGSNIWFDCPIEKLLPTSILREAGHDGESDDFERGCDILDIWFDSGTSWAAVLGNGESIPSTVADMYLEGKDQFTGWFQSSLLTSVALRDKAPYKNILVHGFAVAPGGQKMSKSLGNVIDPMTITDGGKNKMKQPAYGADTLRWWVAESNVFDEVQISDNLMKDASLSVQKVRSCLRFLMSNLNGFSIESALFDPAEMKAIDQYFMISLSEYIKQVSSAYDNFRYTRVCQHTLNHVTKLSSVYFSICKDRLYCEEANGIARLSCQTVLLHNLNAIIKVIAPILPHLAEEAIMHHPCPNTSSAFKDGWCDDELTDSYDRAISDFMATTFKFREAFHSLIGGNESTKYDVTIAVPDGPILDQLKVLQQDEESNTSDLCEVIMCSKCRLTNEMPTGIAKQTLTKKVSIHNVDDCVILVQPAAAFKCPRCRKNTSQANGHLCDRCTDVLSDPWDT